MNKAAFLWGRRAAHDRAAVERIATPAPPVALHADSLDALDALIAGRIDALTAYQDAAYAERYRHLVERVQRAEQPLGMQRLTEAVARQYFRLLAYKDEYEVARLHTDPAFWARIDAGFEGDYTVRFHLAPPLLARIDPRTGRVPKRSYGSGMIRVFRLLARLKGLRGTRWDPFGWTAERRAERELITRYEADIAELLDTLSFLRHPLAVDIARWPEGVRGYGHIKTANMLKAETLRAQLLGRWRTPSDEAGASAPARHAA